MEQKLDYMPLEDEFSPSSQVRSTALLSNRAISSHLSQALLSLGHSPRAVRSMEKCQESTGGYFLQWCDCGHIDGIHPMKHWCNNRTCIPCAEKRKKKLSLLYLKSLERLPQTRTLSLKFLTISPQNYPNLKEGLKDIRKNFRKFIRLKYIKERLLGSIYIIEAKQQWVGQNVYHRKTGLYLYTAQENSWNIHIHAIIYGGYLQNKIKGKCLNCGQKTLLFDFEKKKHHCSKCSSYDVIHEKNSKLVQEWEKCTNGQRVNMHITKQVNKKTGRNNPKWTLNYMLKYISTGKDAFESVEAEAEYIHTTYKTKLIETTGFFKGYKWEKERPYCPRCASPIQFLTCYQEEEAIRNAHHIFYMVSLHEQEKLQQIEKLQQEKSLITFYI